MLARDRFCSGEPLVAAPFQRELCFLPAGHVGPLSSYGGRRLAQSLNDMGSIPRGAAVGSVFTLMRAQQFP